MIARVWHGMSKAEAAGEYADFLRDRAIPDYRGTAGNLGVTILQRVEGPVAHFLILTLWESQDAIRRFAGDEIDRAKYYPEDQDFLLEFEPTVTHYHVVATIPE